MWAAWTGLCLVAALACVLVAYVVDLNLRASVNPSGLACGLQSRSMQKYRSGPQRDLWPLTTNLCVTPVGGPGLLLYFNFLAAAPWSRWLGAPFSWDSLRTATARVLSQVIVWSAVIGFGWLIMAYVAAQIFLKLCVPAANFFSLSCYASLESGPERASTLPEVDVDLLILGRKEYGTPYRSAAARFFFLL